MNLILLSQHDILVPETQIRKIDICECSKLDKYKSCANCRASRVCTTCGNNDRCNYSSEYKKANYPNCKQFVLKECDNENNPFYLDVALISHYEGDEEEYRMRYETSDDRVKDFKEMFGKEKQENKTVEASNEE